MQAYKCDLTGAMMEGTPARFVDVEISGQLVLRATALRVLSPEQRVEGDLSPAAVKKIRDALEVLIPAKAKK